MSKTTGSEAPSEAEAFERALSDVVAAPKRKVAEALREAEERRQETGQRRGGVPVLLRLGPSLVA